MKIKTSILVIALFVTTLLCGCTTSAYKAAGVVVITADRASDGWLDYYVRAKRLPGADPLKLNKQNVEVRQAYEKYQAAMETLYHARKIGTAQGIEAASLAASNASIAVVNLVFKFLPQAEASQLKSTL
jgi:hypothetical protein